MKLPPKLLKFCIYLLAAIASLSTTLYIASTYVRKTFGSVSIESMIFNVRTSEACDPAIMVAYGIRAIPYVLLAVLAVILIFGAAHSVLTKATLRASADPLLAWLMRLWTMVLCALRWCWTKLLAIRRAIDEKPVILLCVILLAVILATGKSVNRRLKVVDYLAQADTPFVEDHYARLSPESARFTTGRPKNLILIFSESLEYGYADKAAYGENLIPELMEATEGGLRLRGYRKTPGGYFTLDGISAQTLGMPLTHLPVDIHNDANTNAFGVMLKKSPGIFNLLQQAGYQTAFFSGTSRNFTHKGDFLKVHGVTETFFKEDWLAQGFELNDGRRGFWDFNDRFLMERFKAYIEKNLEKDRPFALGFETVDTHFPTGWAPPEERRHHNAKDAFRFTSKLLAGFLSWAKTQAWYDETVIVVVGDHPWQDFANDFTNFTQKAPNREIFAAVLNSQRTNPAVRDCGFAPMDMAPTILHAMGIEFASTLKDGATSAAKIGLGTSLFSQEENLVCRYGTSGLTKLLQGYSDFYNSLH